MFFSFPLSLLQWCCFQWAKMMVKDGKQAFCITLFLFWGMQPHHLWDFTFVFPILMSLSYYCIEDKRLRFWCSKFILFCCMVVYFHSVDWMTFLLFSFICKLYAYSMLLFIPSLFCKPLRKFWDVFASTVFRSNVFCLYDRYRAGRLYFDCGTFIEVGCHD